MLPENTRAITIVYFRLSKARDTRNRVVFFTYHSKRILTHLAGTDDVRRRKKHRKNIIVAKTSNRQGMNGGATRAHSDQQSVRTGDEPLRSHQLGSAQSSLGLARSSCLMSGVGFLLEPPNLSRALEMGSVWGFCWSIFWCACAAAETGIRLRSRGDGFPLHRIAFIGMHTLYSFL